MYRECLGIPSQCFFSPKMSDSGGLQDALQYCTRTVLVAVPLGSQSCTYSYSYMAVVPRFKLFIDSSRLLAEAVCRVPCES
jgi:hypothetical protein